MAADITTVLFIVVMGIAVLNFHDYIRCSLILEIVTGEYVCLINADDGLRLMIMYLDIMVALVYSFTWGPLATWPLCIFVIVLGLFNFV